MSNNSKLSHLLEIGGGILIIPFVSHEGRMLCRVSVKFHSLYCCFQWNVECVDFARCCTISTAFLPSDDEDDDDYTPDCEMNEFEKKKGMYFAFFKCCVFIFALSIFMSCLYFHLILSDTQHSNISGNIPICSDIARVNTPTESPKLKSIYGFRHFLTLRCKYPMVTIKKYI